MARQHFAAAAWTAALRIEHRLVDGGRLVVHVVIAIDFADLLQPRRVGDFLHQTAMRADEQPAARAKYLAVGGNPRQPAEALDFVQAIRLAGMATGYGTGHRR